MSADLSGHHRQEVLRESASHDCGDGGCTDPLTERYFRHVADEDINALGSANLHGFLHAHQQLAKQRPPGRANIQVLHPKKDADGWSSSYAVLQIVTDDMPFLVDSVTAALARLGRRVHLLIHPQLWVERDASGELKRKIKGSWMAPLESPGKLPPAFPGRHPIARPPSPARGG